MRRALPPVAFALLAAGPTALAFFSGGYFDAPRAAAAAVAWALVFALAVAGPVPLPASTPGRVAAAALAGLAAWTAISLAWAPLVEPVMDSVQRLLLYLAVLLAAVAVLRERRLSRLLEPALAAGATLVIAYGLAGRLVPGILELNRSFVAGGRLEQPLTYWNAEGLLAAMGFLLCVRLAGDPSRRGPLRLAAAAATAPLGMGVYLSYSRGALAVAVIGVIVLLAAAPRREQLRAALTGLGAGLAAAAWSAAFRGVSGLEGSGAEQRRDGAIVLAGLLALMLAAALISARGLRGRAGEDPLLPYARRLPSVALAAVLACMVGLVIGGLIEDIDRSASAEARPSRFASVSSLRYEYWRIGGEAFVSEPLIGNGAGSFRVIWRMERRIEDGAVEVHSLPLEMALELGLPGLILFGLFAGAIALAGRRALRAGAPLAPGACAVCVAWLLHAAIDWDWQMPAVTLPALLLAAGLLVASEDAQREENRQRSSVPTTRKPSIAVSFLPSSDLRAL